MSYYNKPKPKPRTRPVAPPPSSSITYSELPYQTKKILEYKIKDETVANQKIIREMATIFEITLLISERTSSKQLQSIIDRIKKRILKAKSKYEPNHILSLIFDEKWRKEHLKIDDKLTDERNIINNELLEFFQLKGLPNFTLQQNMEVLHRAYLHTKFFIKQHLNNMNFEYSKKCYLNKLKEIYAYKIAETIEIVDTSKEEDTILGKINFFAFIEESSPAITNCEICYELYKIIYNYIKKYIKQHYRKYPKLTKDEYLQLLEQTYKLKLDNCRNRFKIETMMSLPKSSSSNSSSRSLSGSPPKAKRSPKQTKIDDFFRVKTK